MKLFDNGVTCEQSQICCGTISIVPLHLNTTFRKPALSVFRCTKVLLVIVHLTSYTLSFKYDLIVASTSVFQS
jgi:hypothetical protein